MGLDECDGTVELPPFVLLGLVVLGFFLQFLDESVVFRPFLPVVKGKQPVQLGSCPVPVALARLDGFALFDDARIDAVQSDLRLIVSLNPLGVLFALLLDALVQGLRLLDDAVQLADFAVNILDERF